MKTNAVLCDHNFIKTLISVKILGLSEFDDDLHNLKLT